jgi:hypothetical protein
MQRELSRFEGRVLRWWSDGPTKIDSLRHGHHRSDQLARISPERHNLYSASIHARLRRSKPSRKPLAFKSR